MSGPFSDNRGDDVIQDETEFDISDLERLIAEDSIYPEYFSFTVKIQIWLLYFPDYMSYRSISHICKKYVVQGEKNISGIGL